MVLPNDAKERKALPMARGLLDYFPDALAAVADVSRVGNEQHNPGQPIHWAKHLSTDHADCLMRHLVDRGLRDGDGLRHSAKVAWRALALLQMELEAEAQGVPVETYIGWLKEAMAAHEADAKQDCVLHQGVQSTKALLRGGFDVVGRQPCGCREGYCISHALNDANYYCKHPDASIHSGYRIGDNS